MVSIDWRFIEKYLPRYYSRDDVLLSDIYQRYIESDDVSEEDLQMIRENFGFNIQGVVNAQMELDQKLMKEAIENSKLMCF